MDSNTGIIKIKCTVCGFENDVRYGIYCARCKNLLVECSGNCRKCLKNLNFDCVKIKRSVKK